MNKNNEGKKKKARSHIFLIMVLISVLAIMIGLIFAKKNGIVIKKVNGTMQIWKTYRNLGDYRYELQYPAGWSVNKSADPILGEYVWFFRGNSQTDAIKIRCPRDAYGKELPDPNKIYITEYTGNPQKIEYISINGISAVQWIMGEEINTSLLRVNNPLACDISASMKPESIDTNDYDKTIKNQDIYNAVLQSFLFIK